MVAGGDANGNTVGDARQRQRKLHAHGDGNGNVTDNASSNARGNVV